MTPDGKRAVSASADNTLNMWDLESGVESLSIRAWPSRGNRETRVVNTCQSLEKQEGLQDSGDKSNDAICVCYTLTIFHSTCPCVTAQCPCCPTSMPQVGRAVGTRRVKEP